MQSKSSPGEDAAEPNQVLLCCPVFSCVPACFSWFEENSRAVFGKIALASEFFDFTETAYYRPSMGGDLKLRIYAFTPLISPDLLAQLKCQAIEMEKQAKNALQLEQDRPINIDPGYLNGSKFVLASTKDGSHRISIGSGIFAEITLMYRYGAWVDSPWTYPNYRRQDYKDFLSQARQLILNPQKTSL